MRQAILFPCALLGLALPPALAAQPPSSPPPRWPTATLDEVLRRLADAEGEVSRLRRASDEAARENFELSESSDTAWVLTAGIFVLLMQLGFAMLEGGTVREHNVLSTYAKNILDFVIGAVAATWGMIIAYDDVPFDPDFDRHSKLLLFMAFQVPPTRGLRLRLAPRHTAALTRRGSPRPSSPAR